MFDELTNKIEKDLKSITWETLCSHCEAELFKRLTMYFGKLKDEKSDWEKE